HHRPQQLPAKARGRPQDAGSDRPYLPGSDIAAGRISLLPPPKAHDCGVFVVTPRIADEAAGAPLAAQLDDAARVTDIAAVLLRCAADAGDGLVQAAAAALRPVVQSHGIALLLDGRADLVAAAGADGVHLMRAADYARARRHVADGIVGAGCA